MKKDYRFEVYTEFSDYGDKVFVVKYYDLETVIGVGDTISDAINEAQSNLEVFLNYCEENSIDIPEPSSHEENEYSGKVTLRMSKHLHKLVDERAKSEGVSINLLLNEAIAGYISMKQTASMVMKAIDEGIKNTMFEAIETQAYDLDFAEILEYGKKVSSEKDGCYEC